MTLQELFREITKRGYIYSYSPKLSANETFWRHTTYVHTKRGTMMAFSEETVEDLVSRLGAWLKVG